MPGEARTAAVVGFVEAGLGAGVLLGVLTVPGSPTYAGAAMLLTTPVITAVLLVGSFSVLRGTGRRVMLGTSVGEIALVLGLAGWSLADPSGPYAVGTGDLLITVVLVSVAFGTALPVVQLVFTAQPVVGAWVRHRLHDPAPRRTGAIAVLLVPVAVMMAGSIWVVAAPSHVDYADIAAAVPADWDALYDDGAPIIPPSVGHPAYDAAFDGEARRCHDGDMAACDELWLDTPAGSLTSGWAARAAAGSPAAPTASARDSQNALRDTRRRRPRQPGVRVMSEDYGWLGVGGDFTDAPRDPTHPNRDFSLMSRVVKANCLLGEGADTER